MTGDTKYIPVGSCARVFVPIADNEHVIGEAVLVADYIPGVFYCYKITFSEPHQFGPFVLRTVYVPASSLEVIPDA